MKFQADTLPGVNTITRHDGTRLWVGATPFAHSVLVPWVGAVQAWPVATVAGLTGEHFAQVLSLAPEVVIFGSGRRLCFVPPALMRCLIERRIGVETMDTAAACRTYNVLVSEGRSVLGALLLEAAAQAA